MSDLAAPDDRGGPGGEGLLYQQIADRIRAEIKSGELAPGTRLRSERELAVYYEISYGTFRHAIEVLRDEGAVFTRHGRGTFVAPPKNPEQQDSGQAPQDEARPEEPAEPEEP
jgi:DNA-binding GntR family transcriptional regulator